MRPVTRYELVELIVPANNTSFKIPFLDIPQLRSDTTQDIVIRALETYTIASMPLSQNFNPVVSQAQLASCFLTLYIQQEQSVNNVPMIKLLNIFNSGATAFYTEELNQFEDLMIDWTKSFISLSASLGNAAIVSIMLGVSYQRLDPGTIAARQAAANIMNQKQMDNYNNLRLVAGR